VNTNYSNLEKAITNGQVEIGVTETLKLVESGKKPIEIFSECIDPVLAIIGNQFSRLEIFLPELINTAEVVKAIQLALEPFMEADQTNITKGKIVIATVSGDLHDIGKNLVKAMLEVNGFKVKDLGVDVSLQTMINSAKEFNADIIALSALMLPSLPAMKDVIDFVNASDELRKRFKIIVGGGSVKQEWADKAGADGYGENAIDAVEIVRSQLGI
jgi:5-methyltetrahydrofolate--homocysteine methyltransferase